MTTLSVRLIAQAELADITTWYEDQEPESSAPFVKEYEAVLTQIGQFPLLRAKIYGEIRHVALATYPYHVWYVVDETSDHADVLAVTHQRRDRAAILARLPKS